MQLFPLFMLSCIFILDDNGDNLYNHAVVLVVYVVVFFSMNDNRVCHNNGTTAISRFAPDARASLPLSQLFFVDLRKQGKCRLWQS